MDAGDGDVEGERRRDVRQKTDDVMALRGDLGDGDGGDGPLPCLTYAVSPELLPFRLTPSTALQLPEIERSKHLQVVKLHLAAHAARLPFCSQMRLPPWSEQYMLFDWV